MREILFRGERVDGGDLVYGGLSSMNHTIDDKVFIITIENNDEEDRVLLVEVSPESVGQFTGVLDKHRDKIFEGDRVRFLLPNLHDNDFREVSGVVKYRDGSWIVDIGNEVYSMSYSINGKIYYAWMTESDADLFGASEDMLGVEVISNKSTPYKISISIKQKSAFKKRLGVFNI